MSNGWHNKTGGLSWQLKSTNVLQEGHGHIMTLLCEVTFLANVGERFLMRQSLCRNDWSKQSNAVSSPSSVILTSHIHVHVVIMWPSN